MGGAGAIAPLPSLPAGEHVYGGSTCVRSCSHACRYEQRCWGTGCACGWMDADLLMSACNCSWVSVSMSVCLPRRVHVSASGDRCGGLWSTGATAGPFRWPGWPQLALPALAIPAGPVCSPQLQLQPPCHSPPGSRPLPAGLQALPRGSRERRERGRCALVLDPEPQHGGVPGSGFGHRHCHQNGRGHWC